MCRLFGFRSILNSQVHSSLVSADNALGVLSKKHSDGWGVAYYTDEVPHILKSLECAIEDKIFHKISGVVSSQSVLAHIRKATQGNNNILNSHPFQYGKWVFAHNGNIKNFSEKKKELLQLVSDKYRPFILGDTDSEVIFYIVLSFLDKIDEQEDLDKLSKAIEQACLEICKISGPLTNSDDPCPTENYLTFILTDGDKFVALQGGQFLHYSTHKKECPEKNTCHYYNKTCESPSQSGENVNHLIISSEALIGSNIWNALEFGEMILLDKNLKMLKKKINLPQF